MADLFISLYSHNLCRRTDIYGIPKKLVGKTYFNISCNGEKGQDLSKYAVPTSIVGKARKGCGNDSGISPY